MTIKQHIRPKGQKNKHGQVTRRDSLKPPWAVGIISMSVLTWWQNRHAYNPQQPMIETIGRLVLYN